MGHGNILIFGTSPLIIRVIIPRHEIQVFCKVVIIYVRKMPHKVMRDRLVSVFSHRIYLQLLILRPGIRSKTSVFQIKGGIMGPSVGIFRFTGIINRQNHIIKGFILQAPEDRPPGLVQPFHGAVFSLKPFGEGFSAVFTVAVRGIMASEFIVYLPCNDILIMGIMLCHLLRNDHASLPVCSTVGAGFSSGTPVFPAAVSVPLQNVILIYKPLGRCCSRGAQNHPNPFRRKDLNGIIQVREIKHPLFLFYAPPCKVSCPDSIKSCFTH